jgi:heptosyltransferase-1
MTELLVIKPSSLGDIVQGLQVATSLKAQRPDLRISWIVREMFAPIVRACEAVDQVYVFEPAGGAKGFLKLMRQVRATKFDYVFDMQGLLRTGLMTSRTRQAQGGAQRREGVGRDLLRREGAAAPGRAPQPRPGHPAPVLPGPGRQARAAGDAQVPEVDSLNLKFADGRGGAKPFVMFPDSRSADKKWGGFKQLTEMILREDKNRKVVWAGNNFLPDRGAFPEAQFMNLTGNTSLVSLPALVKKADWVVSNDSGPMHLAAALGVASSRSSGRPTRGSSGPIPSGARSTTSSRPPSAT